MKQAPDTKRLMEALDLMKRDKGITIYKVSKKIGYAPQSFSRIRAGGQNVPLKWIHKICDTYGINKAFVFSAEAPIFLPETFKGGTGKLKHVVNPSYSQRLPLYDTHIKGVMKAVVSDHLVDPNYFTSIPTFRDCTIAYRVAGDSMSPRYQNGDVVLGKWVKDNQVIHGEPYVVITNELSMVKYVDPHRNDSKKFVLRNDNPKFPPTPINKKELLGIYLIKGKLAVS